jgi:hypothetical protein
VNLVKVSGNIVSKNGIVLFFADGTSQVLPNDCYRTQSILEAVLPKLARMETAEIDLDSFSIAKVVEQATNGAVKVDEKAGTLTAKGVTVPSAPLKQHLEEAATNGGGKALKNFLGQFVQLAKDRKHTSDELLHFLKGADLPLADDGSIIGYKMLRETDEKGVMVDDYTKKVRQRLGSLVFMRASKVDDNRRELCGTGLHIARRDYLCGGFGRHLCLVKIKPCDVIAVPMNETSKMRVSAYHIVKVLDDDDAEKLMSRYAKFEDHPKAEKMLMDAIAGNHTPIIETVEVEPESGAIKVTVLEKKAAPRKVKKARAGLLRRIVRKVTVAGVKATIAAALPYEKKLAKAQRDYDSGMSIREIAKKHSMDRESLGKNLKRKAGR